MTTAYQYYQLANGIRLNFLPSNKFKTYSIALFIHQELNSDLAAYNALLPAVMEKGSKRYPDYLTLQRQLENLYGADFSADIMKSGEKQIISFSLETADDKYTATGSKLIRGGMDLLGSVVGEPLVDNQAFSGEIVAQEKIQLIKDIRALLNDKSAYAQERCLALMCADERYGVFRLGREEDYAAIDASSLYAYYQRLLAANPIDLYVVGDLDPDLVCRIAEDAFSFSRDRSIRALPETVIIHGTKELKFHEEMMNVNQAKLVIGYRTNTGYSDPLYCTLIVYSGILGGFPHAKLFMKVREEASLAYYINTRLERHKGLMILSAGINYDDFENARAIIDLQMEDMAGGRISETELVNTKRGLVNQLRSQQDSPGQLISFHLDGVVGGKMYTLDELCAGIEAVTLSDLKNLARRIQPDTVYLLRPRAEGGS